MISYKQALGHAIRVRRMRLKMTQKELAQATGMDQKGTVSRWERGLTTPLDLEVIARALHTTLPELLTGIEHYAVKPGSDLDATSSTRVVAVLEAQTEAFGLVQRELAELNTRLARLQAAIGAVTDEDLEFLLRKAFGILPPDATRRPEDLAPGSEARAPRRGRRRT